jgi:hypothetical protein
MPDAQVDVHSGGPTMLEYAAKSTKAITFTIVLVAAGVLFLVVALGGAIVIGNVNITVAHPALRLSAGVLGLVLVAVAVMFEANERLPLARSARRRGRGRTKDGHHDAADPLGQAPQDIAVTYYDKFPQEEFLRLVAEAKEYIWIQQTWISDWNSLCRMIRRALRVADPASTPEVRLLFIHPDSPLAEARGVHSGERPGRVKAKVENTINDIVQYRDRYRFGESAWCVRVFDTLPTFALFRVDDNFFITPYLRGLNTLNSPCWRLNGAEHRVTDYLTHHFTTIWDESRPPLVEARKAG